MRLRAPVLDDAPAVLEVLDARDLADIGVADTTLRDLVEEWQTTEFDLASNAIVVEEEIGRIVGYASVQSDGSLAVVAPEHESRGIGARMLEWVEIRERAIGRDHRQWVAGSNKRAQQLLSAASYKYLRSYWRMIRKLDGNEPSGTAPEGFSLRTLDVDSDAVVLHVLDAAAFASAPDYREESFTTFCEEHLQSANLDPKLSIVAHHDGQIVGYLLARRWREEGSYYIDILAVHPEHQRRGVGSALLTGAFSRFAAAGLREAQLDVASDNPRALGLYERAGMSVRWHYVVYERPRRNKRGQD